MDELGNIWVFDRADAIRFLNIKGSKVAIQVGFEGEYIFANKSDFMAYLKRPAKTPNCSQFTDYNGDTSPVFVHGGILHIPVGVQ